MKGRVRESERWEERWSEGGRREKEGVRGGRGRKGRGGRDWVRERQLCNV